MNWTYAKLAIASSFGLGGIGAIFALDGTGGAIARGLAAWWAGLVAWWNTLIGYLVDPVSFVSDAQVVLILVLTQAAEVLEANGYNVEGMEELVSDVLAVPVVPMLRAGMWWLDFFVSTDTLAICISGTIFAWIAAMLIRVVMWIISWVPGINGAR